MAEMDSGGGREDGAAKGERFGSVPGKLALELFDSINLPDTPRISLSSLSSRSPFLAFSHARSLPLFPVLSFSRMQYRSK